jgi:indole-3-glycerol phosphate synthase
MSADFLQSMALSSRERVAHARALCSQSALRERALAASPAPPLQLSALGFDLIAELKLRSPALGALQHGQQADIGARVRDYALAGAAAISVLTEPTRFDGELEHLREASAALQGRVPSMRKDFLIDPYQVYEARAAGAGGVLIILRMLEPAQIASLLDAVAELHLFALLEAFDEPDLELSAQLVREHAGRVQLLVGVNCRDLSSLQVVPGRLEALAAKLPPDVPRVAESGVDNEADAARLARAGYDLALVGSALMRAREPLALARALLAAGRQARRCG